MVLAIDLLFFVKSHENNILMAQKITPSVSKKKLRLDKNCVTFGEIFLKPHQTNWNVAKNNASVVADELPSQITIVHLFNN